MRHVIRTGWMAVVLATAAARSDAQPPLAAPDAGDPVVAACIALNTLQLPELAAADATWITAMAPELAGAPGPADAEALPAHCRVRGRIETAIRFEVWLPAVTDWNGRLLALGSTSVSGSIPAPALGAALRAGYAVTATDTGNTGSGLGWIADDARLRDFAYRAIYEMAVKATVMTTAFYQRAPDYRYFQGCSVGGQQGLLQAAHFPEVFDGIVAGAPLAGFTAAQATQLWSAQAAQPQPGLRLLGPEQLRQLNNAAIAQCDTLDGVADNVIEDPRRCNFDPRRLSCSAGAPGTCLNNAQATAAAAIYAGPSPELPGFAVGSEAEWRFALDGEPSALAVDIFRRASAGDPGWSWQDFEFDRDYPLVLEQFGWMLDASVADLSAFREHGGKLIVFQGWNDTVSPPEGSIAYFDRLNATAARDFARLFMVPGMAHCGGGSGADQFDALRALEDWVERAIAPDRIEASALENERLVRTRPLCPYPQTARYRGTGDTDQSGSFVCTN